MVSIRTSNRSRAAAVLSGSVETTTSRAPSRTASLARSADRLTTDTSAPMAAANLTAKWPSPPRPATATRVPGNALVGMLFTVGAVSLLGGIFGLRLPEESRSSSRRSHGDTGFDGDSCGCGIDAD